MLVPDSILYQDLSMGWPKPKRFGPIKRRHVVSSVVPLNSGIGLVEHRERRGMNLNDHVESDGLKTGVYQRDGNGVIKETGHAMDNEKKERRNPLHRFPAA